MKILFFSIQRICDTMDEVIFFNQCMTIILILIVTCNNKTTLGHRILHASYEDIYSNFRGSSESEPSVK